MNFPTNVKYTKEHEWIRLEGDVAYVGITDYRDSSAAALHAMPWSDAPGSHW